MAASTSYRWDGSNRPSETIDALGHSWRTFYDGYGRPSQSVDPLGHYRLTRYDNDSNPIEMRSCSSEGKLISLEKRVYDKKNRLVSVSSQLMRGIITIGDLQTRYAYNELDQLTKVTDPRGHDMVHEYDSAQRLTKTRSHDSAGVLLAGEALELDENGRVKKVTRFHPPVLDGNHPSFTTEFVYDMRGLPVVIKNGLSQLTKRTYDAQGRLIGQVLPDGSATDWAFDGLGRQTRATRPEGIELTWTYADAADHQQVVYEDARAQKTTYLYDGLGRLESTSYADGTSSRFDFDAAGAAGEFFAPPSFDCSGYFDD